MDSEMKIDAHRNLRSFCIFHSLCSFLAILPPHQYGADVKKNKTTMGYKIYAGLVMGIIIGGYIYSTLGKFGFIKEYELVIFLMDTIANAALILLNVLTIRLLIFSKGDKVKIVLNQLYHFDTRTKFISTRERKYVLNTFIIVNFAVLAMLSADAYVWVSTLTFKWFRYYLCRNFQYYHFSITLVLIVILTNNLRIRFRYLNQLLKKSFYDILHIKESCLIDGKTSGRRSGFLEPPEKLKNIARFYTGLSDIVEDFNAIFGFIILFAVFFIIAIFLDYLILAITYSLIAKNLDGVGFSYDLSLLSALWCFILTVQTVTLASSCDGLAAEAKRTSLICYNLLNEIPTIPKTEKELNLKEDLLLLAQQVECRSPCISAAGFFNVNYSMLGLVIGSITSYIIVTVQFVNTNGSGDKNAAAKP